MGKKRLGPGHVAAKTARFVCTKIGHVYPRTDRPFRRCQRCGAILS